MLVNIHHDSRREHNRLLVAGVVFLTAIALLIGLSIAVYQKTFDRVTMVTIQADRAGLQLARFGDVRINGVLVGQVRAVEPGRRAGRHQGRDRAGRGQGHPRERRRADHADHAVRAEVHLVRPADGPAPARCQDGDVIPADRVETNVELSKILADLFPLLRAVQPAELNYTLNALATALEGRGEQLGETLDQLDAYLGAISDKLPTLQQDLVSLANVADTYDLAAPDLIDVLGNLTVTSKTVIEKADDLDVFFSDLAGPGGHLDPGAVRQREEPDPGRPGHRAGAQAAGGLLAGVPLPASRAPPSTHRAWPGPSRATRSSSTSSSGPPSTTPTTPTTARSTARSGTARGATGCRTPRSRRTRRRSTEGSDIDENPPTGDLPTLITGGAARAARCGAAATTSGYAGTDAEKAIVNALLAGETGRAADSYGALGSLLYGPVVRGGAGS